MNEAAMLAELQLTRDMLLASNKRIEKQQQELHASLSQLAVKLETIGMEESSRDTLMGAKIRATKTLVENNSRVPGWQTPVLEALKWLFRM